MRININIFQNTNLNLWISAAINVHVFHPLIHKFYCILYIIKDLFMTGAVNKVSQTKYSVWSIFS